MSYQTNISISDVQLLLEDLEAGDLVSASVQLDKLTQLRQQELYQALGEMTRNLHNTLNSLGDDTELLQQVKHDLPDMAERLEYVQKMTEEASEKTLQASEVVAAKLDAVSVLNRSDEAGKQGLIDELLSQASAELTNIMLAQSYQDLTGQVLKRMMIVVASFERSLLDLVARSGHDLARVPERSSESEREDNMKGVGPNISQKSKGDALDSQDDVDDLLGQLGF